MIIYENNICYRTLDFLGYPKFRIGFDGSLWSYRYEGHTGKQRWKLLKGKKLKAKRSKSVYLMADLSDDGENKKTLLIHRIVLLAFVGAPKENEECCHLDDDGLNNHLDNLRWDTHSNNFQDVLQNSNWLEKRHRGLSNHKTKLNNEDIYFIRSSTMATKELASKFNVSKTNILAIKNRKTWKHI